MPCSTRLFALLLAVPVAAVSVAAAAAPSSMVLQLKHSERVMLSGRAANVIVDDPTVADVAVVDSHSVIVIGKDYGETSVMVLDKNGRTLMHSEVAVVSPETGPVTVYNGAAPSEFSCVRHCEAIPQKDANGVPRPNGGYNSGSSSTTTTSTSGSNGQPGFSVTFSSSHGS